MNRKIQEPLTLPKHPQLLDDLNNMSMAIKLHHIDCAEKHEKAEAWAKAAATKPVPTWEDVEKLIIRAYHAVNEQRQDPRRY